MQNKNIWLILLLFLLLNGCAKSIQPKDYFSDAASPSWEKYVIHSQNIKIAPFRTVMSLHLNSNNESYRISAIMWGNSTDNLRLDVMTGIGTSVAKIEQRKNYFLVYEPMNNLAYFHAGKRKPLLKLEIPIPFSLPELAGLLNGQYNKLFGSEYTAINNFEGKTSYTLAKKDIVGTLQLNAAGLPIVWINSDETWIMTIQYGNIAALSAENTKNNLDANTKDNAIALLPKKIIISGPNSQKTVLFIKKHQQLTKDFSEKNLKLVLPENVILKALKPLDN